MINILIPLSGKSNFFKETGYPYPKSLFEIENKPMIEYVIDQFSEIENKQFIFVIDLDDSLKYHVDNVVKLLTNNAGIVVNVNGVTSGAVCSSLLAIDYINNNNPLIIANGDQYIDVNVANIIQDFIMSGKNAAVLTFNSVHPKWSYIRLDVSGDVIETAEKNPISKFAIAGTYLFDTGARFISAAMKSIYKGSSVNDVYYIAPTINEIILDGGVVGNYTIPSEKYFSFYSPEKIKEFEKRVKI